MSQYETGVLVNGYTVGTKRLAKGSISEYEIWTGNEWIEEWLWDLSRNDYLDEYENKVKANLKCDGCDNPFCECQDGTPKEKAIKDIRKLIKMQDEINREILMRLDYIESEVI